MALAVWTIALFLLAVAAAIPGGPTAVLTADDLAPIVGQVVHFDASLSVGHDEGLGRIVSYSFDFGDGTTTAAQVTAFTSHAYADVGARRASVTVRDARSNEGTATLTVRVQPRPPPTGSAPDLTPSAAMANPASPIEGNLVGVSITIENRGGSVAESATIDVYDERPNGSTFAIGQTALSAPLPAGESTTVYSPSFVAVGVGNHTIRIVVGNVTPPETYTYDDVRTISMTVRSSNGPVGPNGSLPLGTALLVAGLAAAGVAALVGAALILRRPREPGPLEPPPAEPPDRSPPPLGPR